MLRHRGTDNKPLEWTGLHRFFACDLNSLPTTQGQRYPYEMSEALPVLHLEVSHDLFALSYDRRSNGRKYSVAYSYCQGGFPNASKVSMLEAMPVFWLFRF